MGLTNSKSERSNALKMCKERKRFIKQAIDSRYALSAAHVSYVHSLRNIGLALRKYAEHEALVETSVSVSATELDNTPSHNSYPSPSPSLVTTISHSPVLDGSPLPSSTVRPSYMRSSGASSLTIRVSPPLRNVYMEEGEFSMPPPPPPPPEPGSSWDYFDPGSERFSFVGQSDSNVNFDDVRTDGNLGRKDVELDGTNGIHEWFMIPNLDTLIKENGKLVGNNGNSATCGKAEMSGQQRVENDGRVKADEKEVNEPTGNMAGEASMKQSKTQKNTSFSEKDLQAEREDASEFITQRAKDFVSSIRGIDNRFFRASESGKEVLRLLESSKIRVGYAEARGTQSASIYLASLGVACCQGRTVNVSDDQHVTKVITWKRTTSSRSSSSRNPLARTKDNSDDSGSDFMEEICMISGSHFSTLDRLYAWERKLYDEVKASESIHKEYDRRCHHLGYQFAKDRSPQVIDKIRAIVKDLHSRIQVALHAVDSISKRIEKMRDEEMLPQLLELIQGLTKMWKSMLECHHFQYITMSLAYHTKNSAISSHGETQRQILSVLQEEVEYFGLSFANWINNWTSYAEAINSWLQNCILQPQERHRGRRAFSPRRYLAPSIFALCRDWSAGIKSLPSQEVSDAIGGFLSDLRHSVRQQSDELLRKETAINKQINEAESKEEDGPTNISSIQASLTKVLDRLAKFSEASVKMCDDIRQKCEAAQKAYDNYKAPPRSFDI